MRRIAVVSLFLLVGCSSAPVADLMDYCAPGHLPPGAQGYYGGVGNQLPPVSQTSPNTGEVPTPVPHPGDAVPR